MIETELIGVDFRKVGSLPKIVWAKQEHTIITQIIHFSAIAVPLLGLVARWRSNSLAIGPTKAIKVVEFENTIIKK